MGLTQKILLFTGLLVIALVGVSLAFTTFQANRLAHESVTQALSETRQVWETFQADRYKNLKLGVRTLGNDPAFKAAVGTDQATVYDLLQERGKDLGADFFIATDPDGIVIARSDRPTAAGEDLSQDPVVMKPLEGEESSTVWKQGDKLFHAVSVPMQFGQEIVGALVAGYGINEHLANEIRKLTHSEIAFLTHAPGQPPQLSVSSLGPKEQSLKDALGRPELADGGASGTAPFQVDLRGDSHMGVQVPLKAATGASVGSVVALRSMNEEMAGFRRFRTSLIVVSLVVMVLGLGVATLAARRITGPVRTLVIMVEKARSGSFSGKVDVGTSDEIGTLARTFNKLLADLREKEQMISFLREGMTMLKKKKAKPPEEASTMGAGETANLAAVTSPGVGVAPGDLFAARYEVMSTLGKGGMGVVYRAHDRQLDEDVALKVLRADVMKDDPTLLERFKQEIKLARRITHRNVLRTHDFGETDGVPYISMEYLEGVTLKDLVRGKGALPLGVGMRIAKQMCQGLEAAHQQGVIHRDIKPQNMLILPESGELKIMDFGIARVSEIKGQPPAANSGLTTAGSVMGTPDYMPPEQAQGNPADFRSDIYSLGVVLFEVFTGRLPFSGENMMSIVLAHIQKPAPTPRSVNPRIPAPLEAVIMRAMDKNPIRRYQKVGEMLRELSEVSAQVESSVA